MRTPMHRFGQLEELVGAAVFLASDAAVVRHRPGARRRRRLPRERGQPVKPALVISERDNVATALEALDAGQALDARRVDADRRASRLPRGHKVALRAIAAGEPVIKYGSPIGTATRRHRRRARTCTRTTSRAAAAAAISTRRPPARRPRLAEPPDDPMRPSRAGDADGPRTDRARSPHERRARASSATAGPTAASACATTCSSCRP